MGSPLPEDEGVMATSQTDRLGFVSRRASVIQAESKQGPDRRLVGLARAPGDARALRSLSSGQLRRQPSGAELSGSLSLEVTRATSEAPVMTAEALRCEFNHVDTLISEILRRSRNLDPEHARQAASAAAAAAAAAAAKRERERLAAEKDEDDDGTKEAPAPRDPKASVARKLAQRREGLSPPPRGVVPMTQLHVQREKFLERIPLVDVMALKSRSLVSEGCGHSVKALLDQRLHAERKQRLAVAASSALKRSASMPGMLSDSPFLPSQLTWEQRLDLVKEKKQRIIMEAYSHKLGTRREKGAPSVDGGKPAGLDEPDY